MRSKRQIRFLSGNGRIALIMLALALAPAQAQTQPAWMSAVADALERDGEEERSAALRQVVEDVDREYGRSSTEYAEASAQLAIEFTRQGNYAASASNFRRSADAYEAALGADNETVAMAWASLGDIQFRGADRSYSEEAERNSRKGWEIRRRLPVSPGLYGNQIRLATIVASRGDQAGTSEARILLREAMRGFAGFADTHPDDFMWAVNALLELDANAPNLAETIAALEEAGELIVEHPSLLVFEGERIEALAQYYRDAGHDEEADALRERLAQWDVLMGMYPDPATDEDFQLWIDELDRRADSPST